MKNFFYLNLPKLPLDLENQLVELCQSVKISTERHARAQARFEYSMPVLAQEYGNENTCLPADLNQDLEKVYNDFFAGGVKLYYGIAKNLSSSTAVTPPHTDRLRQVAINYLLKTGGNNVITTLYNERNHSDTDLSQSNYLPYSALSIDFQTVIKEKSWHCFDAQKFHGVANVETERYYFSLVLINNITYENFVTQYSHLLIQ